MARYLALVLLAASLHAQALDDLRQRFGSPPDDARIMMRWWWFGPSMTREQLDLEMQRMKEGGIGGFEIQPVYPLALDDPAHDFRNYRYLSPEFLDMVRFTARRAKELGLRMDVTIGSGWSFGGPHIPLELAAGRLRSERVAVAPGARRLARLAPREGERLVGAFIALGAVPEMDAATFEALDIAGNGPLALPPNEGPRAAVFYFASHTGQAVKRAAYGAEGYVLDHYSRPAIETHLKEVGDKLLTAAGPGNVYAVYCDSLEVYDADWTPDLLTEFRRRRGYDLQPLLPLIEYGTGDRALEVRRDVGHTLSELYEERFLAPLYDWAKKNGVLLRIENYGMPPATLASHRQADIFDGEGWHWRTLATTRWASSASHLFGKPVTSSETWTWLHSPAFRATPLDIKAEADQHFLAGINQLIGHGWPYSPPQAGNPGWSFYAAAVFNDKNPWWPVMPDLSRYLQRVSFLLRQGEPVADVALYAPTEDAWASFRPGTPANLDLWRRTADRVGPDVIPAILDGGLSFDVIDDGTLALAGRRYKAIVLPNVRFLPEATARWLTEYAQGGGTVLAVGRKPDRGPSIELVDIAVLGRRLAAVTQSDVTLTPATPEIGFVHRHLPQGDLYFLANTGNTSRRVRARFHAQTPHAELWDPFTGTASRAESQGGEVVLDLEAYGSRVIVFHGGGGSIAPAWHGAVAASEELRAGWRVSFPGGAGASRTVDLPYSWSEDSATSHFSGTVTYRRDITLAFAFHGSGVHVFLDFGEAPATPRDPREAASPRSTAIFSAQVDPPIREAATVFINGQRAGTLWHPPYRLEVTDLLRDGSNELRIEVYNTAINLLAGAGRRIDEQALTARYGLRFRMQEMESVEPLPSGLLAVPKLVAER
jgi:hypothetical protein